MAEPLLRISHLTKKFGDATVVDDLSLEIMPGECLGVIGPNGAGKTTTIRVCLGLTGADAGTVEAFGLRVDDSEAGLYLWATAGEDGRATIERLAARGILAAPGDFYGPAGREHVRIALTATDERVAAAVRRLGRPREA